VARSGEVRAEEGAGQLPRARGRLDVVATPIGNLADLTPRAREALALADLIAAEDTRHTGAMLKLLGIQAQLVSLHDYSDGARIEELVAKLVAGRVIALVSDAGTPLLSDPGYALVRAAAAAGIAVRAVPGPSALTAALSIAGLPTDRFVFEGFLPARAQARRTRLAALAGESRTLVFFEAPHRIAETLADLATLLGGQRQAVIARELTKLHETVHRATLTQLLAALAQDPNMQRGEITLVVEGAAAAEQTDSRAADGALLARALGLLLPELPPARAAAIAAQLAGVSRRDAYALAQRLRAAQNAPDPQVEPPP
jgi:16S rRNA (cytidine1402-2'-O)-methyltransferase